MFGARYRGVIKPSAQSSEQIDANFAKGLDESFWEKRKNIFDLKINGSCLDSEEQLRKLVGRNPVLFKGSAVGVRSAEPGEVMATVAPRGAMSPTTSPAIVARDYGKGRVVYFPAGIDAAYYSYPLPYYRVLLARAMRWAAGNDPPVEVTAPMCVHATVFRQRKDGERLLIHLFNDVNTTAFHGLPNDDVPLREETIPIHDIAITLRDYKIGKAIQKPEGKELPVAKIEAGAQKLTVPRLDIHSIVVVELE
jgi:hypothetical protein